MKIRYFLFSVIVSLGFEASVFALQIDVTKLSERPLMASGERHEVVMVADMSDEEFEQRPLMSFAKVGKEFSANEISQLIRLRAKANCSKFGLRLVNFQLAPIPQGTTELEMAIVTRVERTVGRFQQVIDQVDPPETYSTSYLTGPNPQIFSVLNCTGEDARVVQAVIEYSDLPSIMAGLIGHGQIEMSARPTKRLPRRIQRVLRNKLQKADEYVFEQVLYSIATNLDKALIYAEGRTASPHSVEVASPAGSSSSSSSSSR